MNTEITLENSQILAPDERNELLEKAFSVIMKLPEQDRVFLLSKYLKRS